jgi:decaprenylphospho-beta-D-ribofuranose 2-oxidase
VSTLAASTGQPAAARASLSGWGRTTASTATVHRPATGAAAAGLLAGAGPRGILARGLGRSYGDAAQNAGGEVADMAGLDGVLAFDPASGRVTVQAGVSLDRLLRVTVPSGWFLSSTPGTRYVTVGGAVANDVHGKNHHRDGSIRNAVRSLQLLTPAAGAPVTVEPGDDAGLFAATAGGLGLTGIILAATLQLDPVETAWMRVDTDRPTDLDDLLQRMAAAPRRYTVAWVDCLARGRRLGRSVLTSADHARLEDLPAAARPAARRFAPRRRLAVPPGVPGGLLGRRVAQAFNQAWLARAPRRERGRLRPLDGFFYPLDALAGWNRLYGPGGFVQYQFAVPDGAEATLQAVVERLAAERCPSFLAVLKRFGQGAGLLSFPIAGWSLAVDIPAGQPGLGRLLDELDELVAQAGGRVYLAKDARLRRATLAAMYPQLERWQAVRDRADPAGRLRSDLGRRLGLVP